MPISQWIIAMKSQIDNDPGLLAHNPGSVIESYYKLFVNSHTVMYNILTIVWLLS